jgi:hypothetical protein
MDILDVSPPMRLRESTRAEIVEQNALNFTKYLSCVHHTAGNRQSAVELFTKRFDRTYGAGQMRQWLDKGAINLVTKSVVAPGTSTDPAWAKPLVGLESWAGGFLEIAHQSSLLGRIPGLQQIPFNAKVPYQTAEANYVWVTEGQNAPVSKLAFSDGLTLPPAKVTGIVVLTEELVLLSNAGTAPALQRALTSGLNAFVDKSFLDPASTLVIGQRPGSITSTAGAPLVGTADVVASVKALIAAFFAARPGAQNPVLVANGNYAAAIRGQTPGFGLQVITSAAALSNIIILDPAGVFYADGGLEIEYSREAMLEMADPATNPATAATVLTSLWQHNLVGYRVLRFISFAAAPTAVMYSTMP